jgi:hypothetical protein
MRSLSLLGAVLLLAACGRQTTQLTLTPAAAPADVIDCTKATLAKQGFQQVAFDENAHRFVARRIDTLTTRADPTFRRMVDRVEAEARPAASGKTELTVIAHTVAEYETHRGPTEFEEKASDVASRAAQAVAEACGQS